MGIEELKNKKLCKEVTELCQWVTRLCQQVTTFCLREKATLILRPVSRQTHKTKRKCPDLYSMMKR
nr:MAG TPA: hypothetical protein [Bacteriophage sp.]DAN65683.1 MAG TPA: hypothetical protein [Caudoviricetes sp.]